MITFILLVTAIWAVWTYCLQGVFLNLFRETMFDIRDELFRMVFVERSLPGGEAYRDARALLNELIYFADELNLSTLRALRRHNTEPFSAPARSGALQLLIDETPENAKDRVIELVDRVHRAMALRLCSTSFLIIATVFVRAALGQRAKAKAELVSEFPRRPISPTGLRPRHV